MLSSQGRATDVADWGQSSVSWMWQPLPSAEIASKGYVSNVMGVTLEQLNSIPGTTVYFFGDSAGQGRFLDAIGAMRTRTAEDIDLGTVRFRMDQLYYAYTVSALDVWKYTIS